MLLGNMARAAVTPKPIGIVLAVVQCGDRICLARRSQDVATSRGMWSVVTGYLEPGVEPIQQAWTELNEELGVQPPLVRLVCSQPPLALTSPTSGKQFKVYPFLFRSTTECQVTLNWEHTDVAWSEVSRLRDTDCVQWQREVVLALLAAATSS